VAAALLARVYLYQGDYANAYAEANTVINGATFSLATDLNQVFKKNNSEAIWQIMPVGTNDWTPEGAAFVLQAPPSNSGSSGSSTVSDQLMAAFEAGDKRKLNWIGSITIGGKTYNFPYKYKDPLKATTLNEYSVILRLAEQYLIRAEAEANGAGGGLSIAVSDLNVIRNRAGLSNYNGTVDKPSLMTAIIHERQVELFTEGHRWFDLKRTQTIDTVMQVVTPQKGGGKWDTNQQLYPIPQTDILTAGNLKQNPGY
jgi:hypothetical protein